MQIVSLALSLFVALLSVSQVAAKCPLDGRCPYVATTESTGRTDCPLKTGNCPYYTQHAKDASVADYLTAKDGKCPLEGKCPFYKDLKDGKTVDLTGSNCPIKDTWCEQSPINASICLHFGVPLLPISRQLATATSKLRN
ncbi:hypothetical protein BJ741DRAFT_34740 [Chytriomyces cf. hyalinus JEL632]|nr:hypothetical protein BJ741DRAFT_34740 [Chytriomyces cf. hyalinus JEL632]